MEESNSKNTQNSNKVESIVEKLKKAVPYFAMLGIPASGCTVFFEEVKKNPWLAVLLTVIYEIIVAFLAFGKKVYARVWKDEYEEKLVQLAANWTINLFDWIFNYFTSFGYKGQYNKRIIRDNAYFEVRGLGLLNTFTFKLDKVFVELRISASNIAKPSFNIIESKNNNSVRSIWDFIQAKKKNKESDNIAITIIGAPGCGKTTLLRHIAVTLASNRQREKGLRAYVPILLSLKNHIDVIVDQKTSISLGKLIEDYYNDGIRYPNLKKSKNWFERKLKTGKCLVMLDGLDEVADAEQRKRVSKWVDEQLEYYSKCQFLITSRPQGYKDAPLQKADVLEVQPLNTEQVKNFINNWYLANEIKSSGDQLNDEVRERATGDAMDLMRRLRKVPALSSLTANPLLLTMIAMVHRYRGALPGSRVELYSEICEVLLGRWRQSKGIQDRLRADQKRTVLEPLAAYMMKKEKRDVSTSEAVKIIKAPLEKVGIPVIEAAKLLSELQSGSGLIVERELGLWSFAHLTFQEYLTAAHWLKQKTEPHWEELVGNSWWHETLRLYAAQGDASQLIEACFSSGSISSLTLAVECLEEAKELDPELRDRIYKIIEEDIDSDHILRRKIAAEVMLSRRLRSLHRMDDNTEIDLDFISTAEYQLFIDDMLEQGKHYQPDHWFATTFRRGEANLPITGVRAEDAEDFCNWLTQRTGARFRLPTFTEVSNFPTTRNTPLGVWAKDENFFSLYGFQNTGEELKNRLMDNSIIPAPRFKFLPFSQIHSWKKSLAAGLYLNISPSSQMISSLQTKPIFKFNFIVCSFICTSLLNLGLSRILESIYPAFIDLFLTIVLLAFQIKFDKTVKIKMIKDGNVNFLKNQFRFVIYKYSEYLVIGLMLSSAAYVLMRILLFNDASIKSTTRVEWLQSILFVITYILIYGLFFFFTRRMEKRRKADIKSIEGIIELNNLQLNRDLEINQVVEQAKHTTISIAIALRNIRKKSPIHSFLDKLIKSLESNDIVNALESVKLIKEKNTFSDLRLSQIIETYINLLSRNENIVSPSFKEARFFEKILEVIWIGYQYNDTENFVNGILFAALRSKKRSPKSIAEQQSIKEYYWWLQLVQARMGGKLPAWEGIRLVRESAMPIEV